ncbi:AraC family transcriptional regulator, partial [Burkholderia vietnamiensis]|nr:AraC family transcriptional regulator [Burkholderia vietnamiensis]
MKQDERGTIAISLVAYSVALAARRGVAAEPLLAQAGIAPALLAQPRA